MKALNVVLILCLSGSLTAQEWVIPWVSSRAGQWGSQIVINNHSAEPAGVTLTAIRADGEHAIALVSVPAGAQHRGSAEDFFPELGEGGGFAVFVNASQAELTMGVRVASLTSASGFSPSMGEAMPLEAAAPALTYPIMPADGFSAPVFVNLGDQTANVTVTAYGGGGRVGESRSFSIAPRQPVAKLLTGSDLYPDLSESVYLSVVSDQPLVGANFYFNSAGEPALINAKAKADVSAAQLAPLLSTLETTALTAGGYAAAADQSLFTGKTRMDCPEISTNLQPREDIGFLIATVDWGMGCTNAVGVYHSGALRLDLARSGTVTDFGWLSGELVFTDLVTRFQGINLAITGGTRIEASSSTQNFTLAGSWSVSGTAPVFDGATDLSSDTFLSVNRQGETYRAYGSLAVTVATSYPYDIEADVDTSDPLIYDYAACVWPVDGTLKFRLTHTDTTVRGSLDFGSGGCETATLTIRGVSTQVNLTDLFGSQ